MATPQLARSALVSTDPAFGDLVHQVLTGPDRPLALELALTIPFHEFAEQQVQALRELNPDVVILDLEDNLDLGLRLAQFLVGHNPALLFIAAGPALAPEQLLAAMRAGVADYLPKPVAAEDLRAAAVRAAQKLRKPGAEPAPPAGEILSVFSPKGGGGATTLATNLAIALHRLTRAKTLLVDLDLELGESALVLGVQPRYNLVDLAENFRRMDAGLLASFIERHESGIHLLSAPFHPERAEVVTADQIRRILTYLRQHYEYILVDTPRSFAPPTLAALEQADLVLIVSTLDVPSLRNLQRGFPLLKRVLPKGEAQVRLVLNRFDAGDAISDRDVERILGLKVFWRVSNDFEAVSGSLSSGRPLVLNGKSAYARDLRGLAAAIAGVPTERGSANGRLGRLLRGRLRGLLGRLTRRPRGE